ncbi:MAG: hydroxylamine reductase, partial [Candidatus Bathyarchaeota archaeon]|nr:hydroxylamine reductase [Candidatus Bathyarchaeota archaeon]
MSQNQMFCYQCEQTAKGQGCTIAGVCGKTAEVSNLQDLLVYKLRELSRVALQAKKTGFVDEKVDVFTAEALFATLTNVNFDTQDIIEYIKKAETYRNDLQQKVQIKNTLLQLESTTEGMVKQGKSVGINSDSTMDPDVHSLQWLLTFGLKGVAAYAYHAYLLNKKDLKVFDFIYEGLAAPLNKKLGVNEFTALVFKCGEINIRAMELLDAGNTEKYGHPVPTKVPLGHKKGKALLVSGHDLIDLEEILEQ